MYSTSFSTAHIKLLISSFFLLVCSLQLNAQKSLNCDKDQAAFKKISDTLKATRAGIKKNDEDLLYIKKLIKDGTEEKIRQEAAMEFFKNDVTKHDAIKLVYAELTKKIDEFKVREKEIKAELKYFKREEPILVKSYHLVRDRLDNNCGGVKKDPPKQGIVDVSGPYNSPYGKTVLTMEQGLYNVKLSAIVYYDNGGTSTLTGKFDGVHWDFEWKNTKGQHGTGKMIYMSDETFLGDWVDRSTDPSTKGGWWLRPK